MGFDTRSKSGVHNHMEEVIRSMASLATEIVEGGVFSEIRLNIAHSSNRIAEEVSIDHRLTSGEGSSSEEVILGQEVNNIRAIVANDRTSEVINRALGEGF